MRPEGDLLYDSEASLRLVDHALEELNANGATLDKDTRAFIEQVCHQPGGFVDLSRALLKAYTESVGIVARLRETQGMLESATVEQFQQMHGKLSEVSSATEVATTDILNGLSRGVELVETLNKIDTSESGGANSGARDEVIATLREELYGVMVHLQFQDITSQQLSYISSILVEMKHRLSELVRIFAPYAVGLDADTAVPARIGAFDPNATTTDATARQALADEVFGVNGTRKTA